MSLIVSVFVEQENKKDEISLEKGRDLAGFESSRHKLYGSELSERLGLELLSQLKKQDLYIYDENLNSLELELKVILNKSEEFEKISGYEEDYIKTRVQNILDAIDKAKEVNGYVVIW